MDCPLCHANNSRPFYRDRVRDYHRCGNCRLVFVPPACFLNRNDERAEYMLHENSPEDAGYRGFLARLAEPLSERLEAGASGLDFGCGPGPALPVMLEEQGFTVVRYDPFFAPDPAPLAGRYDFITATEVVEHLHRPGEELERLWGMLNPGGYLGIMTKLVRDADAFATWHYKNDPTHVCFFSRDTWAWWGGRNGVQPEFIGSDVILLRRAL